MPSITETAQTVRAEIEDSPVERLQNLMADEGFGPSDAVEASGMPREDALADLFRSFPAFAFAFGVVVGRQSAQ